MRIALLLVGTTLAILQTTSPALAAGEDCTKATGPYAKALCADPVLHQFDLDLTDAYGKLAAAASAAGKTLVERDEHDRRAYIDERCAPTDGACLASAYHQALASLANFAAQPEGAVMLPVERFKLRGARISRVSAFPRLDRPAEPWADSFERAARDAADALQPDDPTAEAVIDYRPTYLAPDLAAVTFSVWLYSPGAAHGIGHQMAFTYLPAQQRGLRPTDLFQSGTTWSGFLAEQAFDGLQDQAKSGDWDLTISGPGDLERAIADPANWLIRPQGLGLYFAPTIVAPYVAGEREVLIPWADLKPYLAAAPAFRIPS